MTKKVKIFSFIAFIVVFMGLLVFMFSGENFEIVKSLFRDDLSESEFKSLLQSFGIKGSITLSILSMLQVVLTFLPAEPVQVLAGIGYGFWHGGAICLVGVILGNTAIYVLFKIFGDRLIDYFKKNIEIDFNKLKTSSRVALIIFILYFLPAIPYGLICFFAASLQIRYPRYIILTTLGSIPSILIGVGLGHLAIASSWILSLIVFGVLVVILVILAIYRKPLFKKMNAFINNLHKEHTSDTTVKRPNPFVLFFYNLGVRFFISTKVKLKYTEKVKLKSPSIVLLNHQTFFDFMFASKALKGNNVHFMIARLYFYKKLFANAVKSCGHFPKSMFTSDVENVKNCLTVLKNGGILGFMPEARLSTVGRFEDIQESTIKFIKKMGVPVYTLRFNGNYFVRPKWSKDFRKGGISEVEVFEVATPEQLKDMTDLELRERVETALYYDSFKWLETKPNIHYKSKTIAEGLENVLFRCPSCGKELTIKTDKNRVYCSECNLSATLNDRYSFDNQKPFSNFADWYDWQKKVYESEILSTPDYTLSEHVKLFHGCRNGKTFVEEVGEGQCTFNLNGLTYKGTDNGVEVEKFFPMTIVYRLLFGAGENFEIYDGKQIYYFVPDDKRSCVKWYVASEILKNLSEKQIQG
ncbi:MAG: hypothetical protein E7369_00490 [Clostridiales bacterium]|nr:hypothetical protein [Clostridiales bacterium]